MPADIRTLTQEISVSVRRHGRDYFKHPDSVGSAEVPGRFPAGIYAGVVVLLVGVGSLSLMPLWIAMWRLWTTDPLRSIGAVFPLVACAGILAAWRRLDWGMHGTSWALPVIALSILSAQAISVSGLLVQYNAYNGQPLQLMNFGTVLFLYGTGAVLLFGGTHLLRASLFPLCLLLLINPVPHVFNSVVDLPLQHTSASVARSFAHVIGLQPTGEQLRMMFAPDFGMFIAPGCNGVRGSITLGFLALIFGYFRHLRPLMMAFITLAAFAMGYALNLLRLCTLVVYYRIGVGIPSIQKYGARIDYVIGGTLFLFIALAIGMLIRSLASGPASDQGKSQHRSAGEISSSTPVARHSSHATWARAFCFLAFTFVFIVLELRSTRPSTAPRPSERAVVDSFPIEVGSYRLVRTWTEHDGNGRIAMAMGEYSTSSENGGASKVLTLGLWVASARHLVARSKFIQGELAQWTGSFDATAGHALPVHFLTSFYDDGLSRKYDAETACLDTICSSPRAGSIHERIFFRAPRSRDLNVDASGVSLPILLRREWPDSDPSASDALRSQFEADARLFMAKVDLRKLLREDGSQP